MVKISTLPPSPWEWDCQSGLHRERRGPLDIVVRRGEGRRKVQGELPVQHLCEDEVWDSLLSPGREVNGDVPDPETPRSDTGVPPESMTGLFFTLKVTLG